MLDKILEAFKANDSTKKVKELEDEMLDEILKGLKLVTMLRKLKMGTGGKGEMLGIRNQ